MRVRSSYSSSHETLSIRVSDTPIDGPIDSGGIPGLPGVRVFFDPGDLGGLIGVMVEAPFAGRTPEWRRKLSKILGPILSPAEEAWVNSEEFEVSFDIWEPEIAQQRALWAVLHNQLRVSFGREEIQPLRTVGILKSLKAGLAGFGVFLTMRLVSGARGPTEAEAAGERISFFVDPNLATLAGLADDIAIECSEGACWLVVVVEEPSAAESVAMNVGNEVVDLSGRGKGRHRIPLSSQVSHDDLNIQLMFPPEPAQSGEEW